MYVLDTSAFNVFGHYYPDSFPSFWEHINELARSSSIISVKEVKREIENNSRTEHIAIWVKNNSKIFRIPSRDEMQIVSEIFQNQTFQGLVKKQNLLKGMPVADPFIVACAKVNKASVVTQEKYKNNAARIPNVCKEFEVSCIDVQDFLKNEKIKL